MTLNTPPAMALAWMMALGLPCGSALAQSQSSSLLAAAQAAPHPVMHLSASAQTEVAQDWLVVTLAVQKEGLQSAVIQKQLNTVLHAALAVVAPVAKPGALQVSTGQMSVSPRHGREGKVNGWMGSAQLVLQGRDAVQITTLATRLQELTVAQIDWQLSPEHKSAAETRIQAEAVALFLRKAQDLTQQFGFSTYTIKEIHVTANEGEEGSGSLRMAVPHMAASDAPLPTRAGQSRVAVSISGSIALR